MDSRLHISLEAKEDKNKKVYYIGKLEGPFLIDCKEGAVFMIFVSEKGEEEMQIVNPQNNKKMNYKITRTYENSNFSYEDMKLDENE